MSPALSRRTALFGAAALAAMPAAAVSLTAPMAAPATSPGPVGPLTLAQAEAVDFAALWASLSPEAQARIGALAIEAETFEQLGQDGGFHTTAEHRDTAEGRANEARNALPPVIWTALPAMLPTVYDEPYPLWQALEAHGDAPAEVDVRGLGLRPLVPDGWQWFARDGERLVELGGAVDLDSADEGAPRRWQFWTVADIDAERLRRHPEMAAGGGPA